MNRLVYCELMVMKQVMKLTFGSNVGRVCSQYDVAISIDAISREPHVR